LRDGKSATSAKSKRKLGTVSSSRCTLITIERGSDQVLDTHVELKSRFVYHMIRQREREKVRLWVRTKFRCELVGWLFNSEWYPTLGRVESPRIVFSMGCIETSGYSVESESCMSIGQRES